MKKHESLVCLTFNHHRTCLNRRHVKLHLHAILKIGVIYAFEKVVKPQNAIHHGPHTLNTGIFNKCSTQRERTIVYVSEALG